mmetsp:Transcript_5410/g.16090  ORF Transcript_5410/g.16090 Transcript_5410/m.16090 type:complete len:445 (+) Transcript_5410:516-1850(+)
MLPWARKAAAVTCRVSRRHLRPKSGGAPHAVAAAAERRSSLTSSASEVARRSEVHAGWTRERMSEAGRRSACVATAAGAATATALSSACAGVVGGLLAPALRRDTASRSASARRLLSRCCAAGGRSGERLLLSPPSFDLLAFANGILGGLVGITAGCASIDLGLAAAVGVVSGVVFSSASEATSRWGVDDVVDAFAVHGACGVWGLLAVGLFDRGGGLLPTGSGRLLGSQALGALVLAALGCGGAAAAAGTLRWLGVLRVSREQEESGLDSEFGLKAYSRNTDVLQRCRTVSALLSENGFSALDLFDALVSLRGVVYRTFTPQAADHKLEGEVKDILQHLSYDSLGGQDGRPHLAFLSHHKADAGDAARIFVDTARRLLASQPFLESAGLGPRAEEAVRRVKPQDLVWLDSTNLKELPTLLDVVASSCKPRQVCSRPHVTAEVD